MRQCGAAVDTSPYTDNILDPGLEPACYRHIVELLLPLTLLFHGLVRGPMLKSASVRSSCYVGLRREISIWYRIVAKWISLARRSSEKDA